MHVCLSQCDPVSHLIIRFLDDKKQIQTLLLGEHDNLYVKYRHQHITVVIRGVAEELRKFSQDNAAAQYAAAGGKVKILDRSFSPLFIRKHRKGILLQPSGHSHNIEKCLLR